MLFYQNFIPVAQKSKLTNTMDKIFRDSFWDDFESAFTQKGWYSEKTDTEWLLQIPVPGLTKDDLVKLLGRELNVTVPQIVADNKLIGGYDDLIQYMEDHGITGPQ